MFIRLSDARARLRGDETGGDTIWTMLFVVPFMLILVFALIDIGTMFATRYAVTNVVSDTVRAYSAYGGDGPFEFQPEPRMAFSQQATVRLNQGKDGTCTFGPCTKDATPRVQCGRFLPDEDRILYGVNPRYVGDWIACEVVTNGETKYPYKGVTGGVLDTDLGIGFGGLAGEFPVRVIGRSEAGDNPNID